MLAASLGKRETRHGTLSVRYFMRAAWHFKRDIRLGKREMRREKRSQKHLQLRTGRCSHQPREEYDV
jgi:hypothetical protein